MARGKGFLALFFFVGVCVGLLGGLVEVDAAIRFSEPFLHRGRAMHELGDVKEYDHKQGFEATLYFVSDSGNNTFGADINPLHLVVRYVVQCFDTVCHCLGFGLCWNDFSL